ncbi:MAG: hypothetical protein KDC15_11590, partial [Chitinophagaceae bacterium]|nr:hypothetical protein [Chitinophagaceae bacterium]
MKQITIVLSVLFTTFFSKAQNVGIGTTTPLNKLHVAGGLRVDTLANSIDSGLLRHDKNGVVYSLKFTGQSTDVLRGNGTFGNVGQDAWLLYGNSGTDPNTQFIGTTDQTPLRFRIFNTNAGRLDSIGFNTSFGFRTFDSLTTGTYNSALGYKSLISNTTGKYNSAFGANVLRFNTTGGHNTGIGNLSLYSNTTGSDNTAIGDQSMSNNTTGGFNTALGMQSLYSNTTG